MQAWNLTDRIRKRGCWPAFATFGLLLLILTAACRRAPEPPPVAPPLSRTLQDYGVTIEISLTPGSVSLQQDVLLSIRATYPEGAALRFPDIADRIEGFQLLAELESPAVSIEGSRLAAEWSGRLRPYLAEQYRIAPLLFRITANGADAHEQTILSPAFRLQRANLPAVSTNRFVLQPRPAYVPPPPTRMALYLLILLLACLLLYGLHLGIRRIRRQVQILRMSPRERALHELECLLQENLHGAGRYKPFYHRITGIIRQFIEREHGIRAPELTTHEFLTHAANNPAFPAPVVQRLQQFLEAADLVKFAAYEPSDESVAETIRTARIYLIEPDPATGKELH